LNHNNEGQGRAGGEIPRRLFVYNGGFLNRRLRRILDLAGYRVTAGRPGPGDAVGVWGASPTAHRGAAVAARTGAPMVRIEDAFLRSLHPGRAGEPPLGLLIDRDGVHFDASRPSELEALLATHPLDDAVLLDRARAGMARVQAAQLTKYAATRTDLDPPDPGYVLVVDQTKGDASVTASGADRARFLEMLTFARQENPGTRILIRTHPETASGFREGHFRAGDCTDGIALHDAPLSPWALLEGATAVYTVSSQMGFEAILAGHKPRVFGTPFYAGWGLTQDETALPRRGRALTRAQLFAAAMILYPTWYDPYRGRLCPFEDALSALEAQARAWREDRAGWVATGMRLWKRKPLQRFFGRQTRVLFTDDADKASVIAKATGRRRMAWAGKAPQGEAVQVEDGFLRSRGLGAALVPPLSLVLDDLGIYYDPSRPSRLETLIARSSALGSDEIARAENLVGAIREHGLTKYNLSGALPDLPDGRRVLVVGQVEDDASIRLGSPQTRTNAALLAEARAAEPDAVLLYKPHPDVEAGLRPGHVDRPERWADVVLTEAAIAPLLDQVQALWTMTSLAGFEALIRGVPVTTLGAPFYAGWGLTRDLGPVPARRLSGPRPTLAGLVHASLIAYPRYHDPVTGLPCPVEVALDRLATGRVPRGGPANRALSKLQGLMASHASLWR
jgi:capsular polysaccharide export protein